jgi:ubiquinone biosynthesis UbiH/UbiF/VisC/COQ6 family hydroxylase
VVLTHIKHEPGRLGHHVAMPRSHRSTALAHAAVPAVGPEHRDADVLVVGAGPAGLSLACALAQAGWQVVVVEQQPLGTLQAPADDGREIALTHRSREFLTQLGVWSLLDVAHITPLRQACVADGHAAPSLFFGGHGATDAEQVGGAARAGPGQDTQPLGWLVPNHRIRAAAWGVARADPRIRVITQTQVVGLLRARVGHPGIGVRLADGGELHAHLVVAADNRWSAVRRMAGIGASMRDFGRSVMLVPVTHPVPHGGIAWECFRYGHTLAMLPMADRHADPRVDGPGLAARHQSSAVITVASDQIDSWMSLDDAELAQRLQVAAPPALGRLRVLPGAARHHYPLVSVYAHRFAAPHFALIGDAAVGMHPVTAHGFNFGLYGVQTLVSAMRQHGLASPQALSAFEAEHRRVTRPIYLGTNAIVSLFTDDRLGARILRPVVLGMAERAPVVSAILKRAVEAQLRGKSLPFLAKMGR